jgi:O-acetylserine/cysteine efflux transporter
MAGARIGRKEIALLLMVAFMWATNNIGAHLVGQMTHPVTAAGVRFVITALCLLPWLRIDRALVPVMIIISLISGPIHFGLLYIGFSLTNNIGAMTVVMQLWVPLATIFAIPLLSEKPSVREAIGLVIAFAGILIMCFDPHLLDDWRAALLCFAACNCWALSVVMTRRIGSLSGLSIQAWMAAFAGPLMLLAGGIAAPASISSIPALPPLFWLLSFFAAIGSGVLGNVLVFNIVRRFPVSQVTPVLLTAPVFALVAGMALLGEKVGVQEALGGAITLAAILFIVRGRAASGNHASART